MNFRYIDYMEGMKYNDNRIDCYIDVLKSYVSSGKELCNNMNESLEKNNIHNYIINVHALKSASRTIGAREAYELALELETAARSNKVDIVVNKHINLYKLFQNISDEIMTYIKKIDKLNRTEKINKISKNELIEQLIILEKYLEKNMYVNAEKILKDLQSVIFDKEELGKFIDKTMMKMEALEFEVALAEVIEMHNKLIVEG